MKKKAFLKRLADMLEKLAVGGMVIGLFDGKPIGLLICLSFAMMSFIFTELEARQ